ncbi:hypothetical protein BC829DRAFT_186557 [Chytridium lagenaria]|nr:hypothetical protein BC829DRAFT_186557 [Chytridium lagenaria]
MGMDTDTNSTYQINGAMSLPCGLLLSDIQSILGPMDATFSDLLMSCNLDTDFSTLIPPCMPTENVVDLESLAEAWASTLKECDGEGGTQCGDCPVGKIKKGSAAKTAAATSSGACSKEAGPAVSNPVTLCSDGSLASAKHRRPIQHREIAFETEEDVMRQPQVISKAGAAEMQPVQQNAPVPVNEVAKVDDVVIAVDEKAVQKVVEKETQQAVVTPVQPLPVSAPRFKNPIGDIQSYDYAKGYRRLERFLNTHISSSGRQRILASFARLQPAFQLLSNTRTRTASDDLASELALRTVIAEHLGQIGEHGASILNPPPPIEHDAEKAATASLDALRQRLARANEDTPPPGPAVVIWRRTGEVVAVSEGFAQLLGLEAARLVFGAGCGPDTACGRGDPDGVGIGIHEVLTEDSAVSLYERFSEVAVEGGGGVLSKCEVRDPRIGISCSFGGPDELAYPSFTNTVDPLGNSVASACAASGPEGAVVARNGAATCLLSFAVRKDFKGLPVAVVGTFVPVENRGDDVGGGSDCILRMMA